DVTICKICRDTYTTTGLSRPHSLSCGHTLCGVCATRLLVDGEIVCPVCKQTYKYHDINKITINHEVEDIIERMTTAVSLSADSTTAITDPAAAIPKHVPTPTGPKLHYGICEEHGAYKVHYCLTHTIFICSDCVVAYHLDGGCRRFPIAKVLNDRKADLSKKIDSHMSSLQDTGTQVAMYNAMIQCTEHQIKNQMEKTELQAKLQIEKLQSEIEALTVSTSWVTENLKQQMDICQKSASKYSELIDNCKDRQNKAQFSKNNVKDIANFQELNNETQWMKSSEYKTQEWTKQVEVTLNQGFESFFTSETFANLVRCQETYGTFTHNEEQRWGRYCYEDGNILLQDFRSDKPKNEALVIDLRSLTEHVSFPRHVYMQFTNQDGTSLGRIFIKVNEEAPRQAQQIIDLCLGKTGARWAGSSEICVAYKGRPKEVLLFSKYLTIDNVYSCENILPDLEAKVEIPHKQGLVVPYNNTAGFDILTNTDSTDPLDGPPIGKVVSGLQVLEQIIQDNLVGSSPSKSQMVISESGLLIGSTCKNR
ncbi:unnamed protein product, partial [Meganyctiphanes norvegica]